MSYATIPSSGGRMVRQHSLRLGTLVTLLLLAAGCAPPAERDTELDTPLATPEHEIILREWEVDPTQDAIPPGPSVLVVRNTGQYAHALKIEGEGGEWETESIPAGAEARLAVDLPPGSYVAYCPIEDERGDHHGLGMRANLVVRQ